MENVEYISNDDFNYACTRYVKWDYGPFLHILKPIKNQQLKYLVLWVKDKVRAQEPPYIPNGAAEAQFRTALEASLIQENMKKKMNKVRESFLYKNFNTMS